MSIIPNGITEEIRAELARQKRTLRDLSKASGISYDSPPSPIQGEVSNSRFRA